MTLPPSGIKWSGGKRSSAKQITGLLPASERYFEPFFGGGSVLFCRDDKFSFASDVYGPLIDFWVKVRRSPEELLAHYEEQWNCLQKDLPGHYYRVRERFNANPTGEDLCFLSRTCVNGIIRFNSDGQFNNSFHLSRRGMTPAKLRQAIMLWSERLKKVEISKRDYRETLGDIKKGDLVYLDPPYGGSSNRYISDINIAELVDYLEKLNSKGARWALSFDGSRGGAVYSYQIPRELYKNEFGVSSGISAVTNVLSGEKHHVVEKLYTNFSS
ncbi:MAG: DNA adenine methylase [Opitutales bacterium]|jgi:DNA adenine methylase|nr:DNA adenine methylase [Opitutales bacterium]